MAKHREFWLSVRLTILLACAGCDAPRSYNPPAAAPSASKPVESPTMSSLPVEAPPIEAAPVTSLPESKPAEPVAASEPASAAPESPPEPPPAVADTGELYHDSFADVAGSIRWNRDGVKSSEGPPSNRTIYFFFGKSEGGPLVMQVVEDSATHGPDEKPGVLALAWQELPATLPYSGFTYLGGRDAAQRLALPPLKLAKSGDDLKRFRLQFRHKAVNASRTPPISLTVGCRLEPALSESYAKRIDLGNFTVTEQWGGFDVSLGDGENADAFLAAIAGENPSAFKIVWSQAGPLKNYQSGDTLLIDDVVITHAAGE